jgi:hypothetical protein
MRQTHRYKNGDGISKKTKKKTLGNIGAGLEMGETNASNQLPIAP